MRRHRGCLYVPLSLLAFLAAVWILHAQIFTLLGDALVEDDGPQKADCAVVLGGDGFGSRILKASQLAQAGYVPYIFVDGPSQLIGHESDMTIDYAEQKGYPASLFKAIGLPPQVSSTLTEAEYVGNILKQKGVRKILLVTSTYHTRRAAADFRRANPWLRVVVVAAPDPNFTPDGWWKNRDGEKTFVLEWTKTFATAVGF